MERVIPLEAEKKELHGLSVLLTSLYSLPNKQVRTPAEL
jgi:hypothetical protein